MSPTEWALLVTGQQEEEGIGHTTITLFLFFVIKSLWVSSSQFEPIWDTLNGQQTGE